MLFLLGSPSTSNPTAHACTKHVFNKRRRQLSIKPTGMSKDKCDRARNTQMGSTNYHIDQFLSSSDNQTATQNWNYNRLQRNVYKRTMNRNTNISDTNLHISICLDRYFIQHLSFLKTQHRLWYLNKYSRMERIHIIKCCLRKINCFEQFTQSYYV